MKSLEKLEGYQYGRDASLGGALRAWMAQNGASEHEAAAYLQQHGINGAIGNFSNWLDNNPSGELYTVRAKLFEHLTGIDTDRVMVVAAKQAALARDPSLEGVVRFDTYGTRRELVDMACAYAESNYGGNMRCVTVQLGVPDGRLSAWKTSFLPGGEDLEKLVVGMARGLLEVTCVEDFLVDRICRGMFGLAPEVVFPGINRFETLLAALFHILGKRNRASDKKAVFGGMEQPTVDRMRKWKAVENKLPMSSVIQVVRALLTHKHPGVIPAFDAASEAFVKNWALPEPIALNPDASAASPHPAEPAPAPSRPEPQRQNRVEPDIPATPASAAPPPPTSIAPAHVPAADDDTLALLARLRDAAPLLRGLADILNPPPPAAAPTEPFALAIGETVDGMEHSLGTDGFPDFRKSTPTDADSEKIRRTFALMRKLLLAVGGLSEGDKTRLMGDIDGDVQETVLLAYALLKYGNVRTALKIIEANLQMGRAEVRTTRQRRKQ